MSLDRDFNLQQTNKSPCQWLLSNLVDVV
jgi:hypothetical protein